jgi:hypothetical protein
MPFADKEGKGNRGSVTPPIINLHPNTIGIKMAMVWTYSNSDWGYFGNWPRYAGLILRVF